MLSRVLRGAEAANASPAIFPQIASSHAAPSAPDRNHPGSVAPDDPEPVAKIDPALIDLARREAFAAGLQQGEQEAARRLEPVSQRLNLAIAECVGIREDLRGRAERDSVQLALLIARRILHRELAVDENALNAIARVALERLAASESCTVTVHPRFAQALVDSLPARARERVRVEPDASAPPGTLVFHAADGVIEASVDAQLDEISRGLADRLSAPLPAKARI